MAEKQITDYFIDNNIWYEKAPCYSELIENCRKKFDWKIKINDNIYYIEYFGLYSSNPKRRVDKIYNKRTKKKIKLLYKNNIINHCMFLFPFDLHNGIENIFKHYEQQKTA